MPRLRRELPEHEGRCGKLILNGCRESGGGEDFPAPEVRFLEASSNPSARRYGYARVRIAQTRRADCRGWTTSSALFARAALAISQTYERHCFRLQSKGIMRPALSMNNHVFN
jgi:hypothetical protein